MMTTAAGLLASGPVLGQGLVDQLVAEYQAQGYDFIEVQNGRTQIKVEATLGDQTLEVIYDAATGTILKSELEAAEAEDIGRTGVQIRNRDRDFLDDDDLDGDDDDDDWDDSDDDSDDDDSDDDDDDSDDDEDDDDDDDDDDDA